MKKGMILAAVTGLLAAALTGCGKPTVESLVDGMFDGGVESQTAEIEMDMELEVSSSQGLGMDISVGGDVDVQISGLNGEDVRICYADGDLFLKAQAVGINEKVGFEAYLTVDDETAAAYAYHEQEDEWYMKELELDRIDEDFEDIVEEMTEALKDVLKENGELAEDLEEIEGEECYVLTASIEGGEWVSLFEPLLEMVDDDTAKETAEDLFSLIEYLSADMTFYISKENGYLLKAEADLSATDIYGMMVQGLKESGGASGLSNFQDTVEEISFSEFSVIVVFSDINDTDVEIPDDVVDDAVVSNETGDIMDGIGVGPLVQPDLGETDQNDNEPAETEPVQGVPENDERNHDGYVTLNKYSESDTFLCEVKLPDGFSYDEELSDPEEGYLFFFDDVEGGLIMIMNRAMSPLNDYLLNGSVEDNPAYTNYSCETEIIGTVHGADCILVHETYYNETYDLSADNIYCVMKYNDGGSRGFITVSSELRLEDDYTKEDWLALMKEMFESTN